jgi:hypothetical protein
VPQQRQAFWEQTDDDSESQWSRGLWQCRSPGRLASLALIDLTTKTSAVRGIVGGLLSVAKRAELMYSGLQFFDPEQ